MFNSSVFAGIAHSKGFARHEKKDVQVETGLYRRTYCCRSREKSGRFREGKEQEGKEKEIRALLEETSPKISIRMKRNLSSKILTYVRELPVLLHYH